MNFISNLFAKNNASEKEILNLGLKFAMEFGEKWLQPIQNRLSNKYTFLETEKLNEYNIICKNAMNYGQNYIYKTLDNLYKNNQTIKEKELKEKLTTFMLEKYSWIAKNNLRRLYSQSCYYAFKDGLEKTIR